ARRSLMWGTAAAASSRSTVMRTISEPARASAATCRAVPSTSAVSVLVMDCTTTGASPPTMTPPTSTATDRPRWCGPASVMLASFAAGKCQTGPAASTRTVLFCASCRAAVGADAGELDHRRFRRKTSGARGRCQRRGDLLGGGLADGAAALADQEHHEGPSGVVVHASHESIAALNAVHETVLAQELERAVGGDRCRPGPLEREPRDDLVGAERLVRAQQRGQDLAADRRQALAALGAQRLGHGHGIRRAAVMVMPGTGKDRPPPRRWLARGFGFWHARILIALTVFRSCCNAIIYIAMQQSRHHITRSSELICPNDHDENASHSARKPVCQRAQAASLAAAAACTRPRQARVGQADQSRAARWRRPWRFHLGGTRPAARGRPPR